MKRKKLCSFFIIMALVLAVAVPAISDECYAAFSVRSSMASFSSSEGKAYYYSDNNLFYKYNLGPDREYRKSYGGYCVGNCTWYAYGRASEILGYPLSTAFRWSAGEWWRTNKQGNYYPYGSKPKVGAIACYSGHVAIVEKVVNGKPYVSESGWSVSKTKPSSASKLKFHYGSPWRNDPLGYIYILDAKKITDADYAVKISVGSLNMRTGPGTGYDRVGYIKKGTYNIVKECGDWVQLESNGYWICMDYAKKVDKISDNVVDTGTSTDYSAKITVTNLNMRTGPGTKYSSKGYIKPGTYTIIKTDNGWGKVKETGYWVSLSFTTKVSGTSNGNTSSNSSSDSRYTVKISTAALNMRSGPGTSYSSKGLVVYGSKYEICDTKNGWGKLSKNGYWIKLSYTVPVDAEYNVKIKADSLNMRTGPGTSYKSKGYIKPGTYTITETKSGWGKLKKNGYWIKLSYTTKI
ncbi:MAG: CHAP domain-containing protein [Bacillota bacterium]|nr:CHAP domain-containing protein [Bacillota bacterium]